MAVMGGKIDYFWGLLRFLRKSLQDFGMQSCLFESRIGCKTVKLEVKYVENGKNVIVNSVFAQINNVIS